MSRRERWIAAGLVLLSAVIVSRGSHGMSGTAPHYLAVSHSLAHDFDLDLRNQFRPDGGYIFQPATVAPDGISTIGRDGGVYPVDGVGFSAAMVPVFVAVDSLTGGVPDQVLNAVRWDRPRAARDLISVVIAVLAAWTAVLTLRLTTTVAGGAASSTFVVVLAFVTSPLLSMSLLAFVEIPAALLCVWFVLERLRPHPRPLVMALLLALLPWLHLRYAVIAMAGMLWAAHGVRQVHQVRQVVGLPVASLAVLAALRFWLFGTLLPDLPVDAGWMTVATLFVGVPGLLLDMDFGLLWVAPFWIVALLGIGPVRRARAGFARFTGRALMGVLLVAAAFGTWRGFGPAAREWVPLLPLLVPFCAAGLQRIASSRWRWPAYAGVGWALALSIVILDRPARLWTEEGAGLGRMPAVAARRLAERYMPLNEEAFVNRVRTGDSRMVGLYLRAGFSPESGVVDAVRSGHADVLERLAESGLEPGVDVARALIWAEHHGNEDMVATLRAAGARPDMTSARGETALIAAVTNDRPDELEMLLDRGADLNATTRAGQTALAFAVGSSEGDVAARLIAAGADVNVADADGWTPLMVAVRRASPGDVRLLLDAGADVNAMSRLGWTALMWASYAGEADIVGQLLSAGADVNLTSKAGQTALIRAAGQGHATVVRLLVESGAEVAAQVDSDDALAWATRNGHAAVADLLQQSVGSR